MLKKIITKIKQKRFEKEKAKYRWLELRLKTQGIKHIRYTKYGVPFPDWDKILEESWCDENGNPKPVLQGGENETDKS